MDIKEKNIFQKIFEKNYKILPIDLETRFVIPFFVIGFVIMIGMSIYQTPKQKQMFFHKEINCKLGERILTKSYRFYKINGEWIGIQGAINAHICSNDSISKKKDSYEIFVFHPAGFQVSYNYSRIFFESIENNDKLKKYFKQYADTLKATSDCNDRRIN